MKDNPSALLEAAVVASGKAWAAGDIATLEQLLSPTYVHQDAYGARLDRRAWLAYVTDRRGRATTIEFRDVEYRLLGDTAIVTGANLMQDGVRSEGDSRALEIVFTQVWVRHDDRWLRETFQATIVAEGDFT